MTLVIFYIETYTARALLYKKIIFINADDDLFNLRVPTASLSYLLNILIDYFITGFFH